MDSMVEYYSQRAPEYDEIYHRDDRARQDDLVKMGTFLQSTFAARRVLEVACGTGYWTRIVAETAAHVTAIDASRPMLDIARQAIEPFGNVQLQVADAYRLENLPDSFDAGVAMFWFSHVSRARVQEFLTNLHRKLGRGAVVVLADNVYVPGVGGELVVGNESGDSFKLRKLKDGSTHRIIKNYYKETELRGLLSPHTSNVQTHFGQAYWWAQYVLPA